MGGYFDYCMGFINSCQLQRFFNDFVVHVGEVREAEEMRCCSQLALSWGFKGKCSFGCMHQTFARCLVMVQKSFGHTFTHVSGAPEALVLYFKGFGGQPAGKEDFLFMVFLLIEFWWEPLKEGLSLNTSYLIQYLLTVDLRLETCFTIDS